MEDLNEFDQRINEGLIQAFTKMFIGLLITTIVAFYTYKSGYALQIPYLLLGVIELVVVLVFSFAFKKLSPTTVNILFYAYSILNGLTMSCIFAVYTMSSISSAFLVTSLLFGGLALYGKTTNKDLTKLGTMFTVCLIVGILMSIVNMFLQNSMLSIVIDWAMLFLFLGITAYDVQKLKIATENMEYADSEKIYVYFAMQLYLDFINIFIRVLSILGGRRK